MQVHTDAIDYDDVKDVVSTCVGCCLAQMVKD